MKISIVTAAYNGSKYVALMLGSVLAQTVEDWEMVFVDDGSTDNTADIADSYAVRDPRIRVFRKENGGVATARNFGYARTSDGSDFVIFLDQDDLWRPDALRRLVDALDNSPSAVAAHGLTRQIDADGNPFGSPEGRVISWERRKVTSRGLKVCERSEPTTFAVLINHCNIPTPGVVLIRRKAMERVKIAEGDYFDQSVATGDDWDLWLRLSVLGDIAFVDQVLLDWRIHESNGSRGEEVTFASESKVRLKMARWNGLPAEYRRLAHWRQRRVCASVERQNARQCWQWTRESLRTGNTRQFTRLLRETGSRYAHYYGLKIFWSLASGDGSIPHRLVDPDQVLKA